MKSFVRVFITQHPVSSMNLTGEEVMPPDPGVIVDSFGQAIDLAMDPNVTLSWSTLSVANDNLNVTIVWQLSIQVIEPGDTRYVQRQVPDPPIVPRQRLFITFELLTREEVKPEGLQQWFGERLRDCPIGYLSLKEVVKGPDPTVWSHIAGDRETIETPSHLKDPLDDEDESEAKVDEAESAE